MLTTTQVDIELLALIEFVESGLLPPHLQRRFSPFAVSDLKMALRDLLDWLSLRGILRGRASGPNGVVHPLTGRIIAAMPALSQYLCVPDDKLAYRVEVPLPSREELEDFVKDRIWHPYGVVRSAIARAAAAHIAHGNLAEIGEPLSLSSPASPHTGTPDRF
jgi:hypothetical protein